MNRLARRETSGTSSTSRRRRRGCARYDRSAPDAGPRGRCRRAAGRGCGMHFREDHAHSLATAGSGARASTSGSPRSAPGSGTRSGTRGVDADERRLAGGADLHQPGGPGRPQRPVAHGPGPVRLDGLLQRGELPAPEERASSFVTLRAVLLRGRDVVDVAVASSRRRTPRESAAPTIAATARRRRNPATIVTSPGIPQVESPSLTSWTGTPTARRTGHPVQQAAREGRHALGRLRSREASASTGTRPRRARPTSGFQPCRNPRSSAALERCRRSPPPHRSAACPVGPAVGPRVGPRSSVSRQVDVPEARPRQRQPVGSVGCPSSAAAASNCRMPMILVFSVWSAVGAGPG